MTSRHITAAEVRHQQESSGKRWRERDIKKRTRKRRKENPTDRERERAKNIFQD